MADSVVDLSTQSFASDLRLESDQEIATERIEETGGLTQFLLGFIGVLGFLVVLQFIGLLSGDDDEPDEVEDAEDKSKLD